MAKSYKYAIDEFTGLTGGRICDIGDKRASVNYYVKYDLARSNNMFIWTGLPDTIPARSLERMLQTEGYVGICKVDESDGGGLWAFTGGLGGTPSRYYMPTLFIVANPTLKRAYNFPIYYPGQDDSYFEQDTNGDKCVIIENDSEYMGLRPLYTRYANLMVENDISLMMCDIMSRISYALAAGDDNAKRSAEKFLQDLSDGKMGVIADNDFIESIRTLPLSNTGVSQNLSNLIEYQQYLKASKANDIGLNANYNMKRESINSNEAQLNNDALMPLINDMLICRQRAAERINELFGLDVNVELASTWKKNAEKVEAETALEEQEVEAVEEQPVEESQEGGEEEPVEQEEESDETQEEQEEADEASDEEADVKIDLTIEEVKENETD